MSSKFPNWGFWFFKDNQFSCRKRTFSRVWLIVKVKVLEVIIIETVIQAFHWLTTPHSIFQRIEKHSRIQISFNNAQLSKPFHNATSLWLWLIIHNLFIKIMLCVFIYLKIVNYQQNLDHFKGNFRSKMQFLTKLFAKFYIIRLWTIIYST